MSRSSLSFRPDALVPGQRPDLALNSAQFAAAQGMINIALEVYVAQAAMNAK